MPSRTATVGRMPLMTVGAAITGLGGTAAVAFWIYTLESKRSFFSAPGWVSLGVLALGLALLAVGLSRSRRDGGPRQHQRGGDSSTNVQAGRDIRIGRDE